MTITILTPDSQQVSKGGRRKTDSKHFVKGKANKDYYQKPFLYNVVKTINRDVSVNELDTLFEILKEQERTDADWILFFEGLVTEEKDSIRATGNYLQDSILRYVIQLDFDGTYEGANFLTLEERHALAVELLPSLEGVQCVVHLSNKAGFIKEYPNHLALRIYIELDEREGNKNLRTYFKPYGMGTTVGIDNSLFSNRRKHLLQRPTVGDEYKPTEFEKRVIKIEGKKFSISKMRHSSHFKNADKSRQQIEKAATQITGSHVKATEKDLTDINELAAKGYFDTVLRHSAHHQLLAKAVWRDQNENVIMDVICNNPEILGSKTRSDLETQVKSIHEKNINYFDSDIALKEFDYRLDVNNNDLKNADLSELLSQLTNAVKTGKPLGLVCRSPHGSGKTMALLPMIYKCLEEQYPNRPIRLCYISGLRSITTGTTRKLVGDIKNLECYLDKDGSVDQQTIDTAHSISIGAKSLERVSKTFDIVFADESEELGMWSTWDNSWHNNLVQIMAQSKVFVLADADASDLTYSLATRAQEFGKHSLAILDNGGSWIQGSTLTLLTKMHQAYDKIIEEVTLDKSVFVHVDYAGDTLLASCHALNKILGGRKVVSFCSQNGCSLTQKEDTLIYGMSGLQALAESPEETIDYLISRGYRAIIVSPTIQKGWRYNSENNRFDTTIGIYIYLNITAPTIVQRTQRCVGVTDHYVFQQASSSYIDTNAYEANLLEEMEAGIFGGYARVLSNPLRHNKEILDEARLIQGRHKTNIKLHLNYVWQNFGGTIKHEEAKEKSKYDEIRKLLKEAKKELRLEEAHEYLLPENKDRLTGLKDRFTIVNEGSRTGRETNSTQKIELNSVEQIMDALTQIRRIEYSQLDVEKVLRNVFSTEEDSKHWDKFGASWRTLDNLSEDLKIEKSLLNQEGGGHAKIWLLLDKLNTEIFNPNKFDIRELRTIDKKRLIAINVDDIERTEFHKIFNNYRNLYLEHLPTMNKYKSPKKFLKKLVELVFQCKVKYGEAEDVKNVKAGLIKDYMERGFIPKSKNLKPNTNDRPCSDILRKRIMEECDLSNAEADYVNHSGKIIILTLPQVLPTHYYERYEYLSMRYEEAKNKDNLMEEPFEVI